MQKGNDNGNVTYPDGAVCEGNVKSGNSKLTLEDGTVNLTTVGCIVRMK